MYARFFALPFLARIYHKFLFADNPEALLFLGQGQRTMRALRVTLVRQCRFNILTSAGDEVTAAHARGRGSAQLLRRAFLEILAVLVALAAAGKTKAQARKIPMRPVALGRKNWIHIGSPQSGLKVAAILSVVESCRRLKLPIRHYLAAVLPGLADLPIKRLSSLTPSIWASSRYRAAVPVSGVSTE